MVAILCPSGYDFFCHAAAIWFSGFALLPIALGTTPEGIKNLCSKTGACAILAHQEQEELAQATLQLWEGEQVQAPTLVPMVEREHIEAASSSSSSSFAPASNINRHSTLIIFHSSGSTGLPKPIYHIHDFWLHSLSTAPGVDLPAYTTTPLYHGGMSDFFRSLQAGSSLFFHPITGPGLSTQAILDGCTAASDAAAREMAFFLTVPFILEMLSKDSSGLSFLASMQLVSTGGAPLPQAVGDLLVVEHSVPLVSRLGSSECGFLMSSYRDFNTDKGWNWLRGQEKVGEDLLLDWRENEDNPGLFELVVTGKWPTKLIANIDGGGFSTEDLYVRRKDGRYQYATRVDDTLVLLNGKKFAAGLIEAKLRGHEIVEDAVVFGSNRAMVGAIVIPETSARAEMRSDEKRFAFAQSLRPFLDEQLNASLPLHARLAPELIVVADEELAASIPRSSKGTLQRGQAYRKLEGLFDQVYGDYERGTLPGYPDKEALRGEALRQRLLQLANGVLPQAVNGYEDDLHRAGLDSIGATRLKAAVNQSIVVKAAQDGRLEGNVVYDCPTIEALAKWIEGGPEREETADTCAQMLEIVQRYGRGLPEYKPCSRVQEDAAPLVILTGATGALGSQLLCQLPASSPVICLVRAQDDEEARRRVRMAVTSRKLDLATRKSSWEHVHCLAATLADEGQLGVSSTQSFEDILSSNAHRPIRIIHAAWSVNFALSLRSFEADTIRSLSHLLGFALRRGATGFLFCSSVASVMATASSQGGAGAMTLPEELSSDPSTAGSLGYSQSKWVGEALVARAAQQFGLPRACIARIGQLCSDSKTGVWNETEAWPLMARAGLRKDEVGAMPLLKKQVLDWLPVDTCARALLELIGLVKESGEATPPPLVAHVCLPCDAQGAPKWEHWLDWLEEAGGSFDRVSLAVWLAKVEERGGQVRGRALIDIWRSMEGAESGPRIETKVAREDSQALREAKTMDARLARLTLEHWRKVGFI